MDAQVYVNFNHNMFVFKIATSLLLQCVISMELLLWQSLTSQNLFHQTKFPSPSRSIPVPMSTKISSPITSPVLLPSSSKTYPQDYSLKPCKDSWLLPIQSSQLSITTPQSMSYMWLSRTTLLSILPRRKSGSSLLFPVPVSMLSIFTTHLKPSSVWRRLTTKSIPLTTTSVTTKEPTLSSTLFSLFWSFSGSWL